MLQLILLLILFDNVTHLGRVDGSSIVFSSMTPVQDVNCTTKVDELMQSNTLNNAEIASNCRCRARKTLVKVPWADSDRSIEPKYVTVLRCSGACHSTAYQECVPRSEKSVVVDVVVTGTLLKKSVRVKSHEMGCDCTCPWNRTSCRIKGGEFKKPCSCHRSRSKFNTADTTTTLCIIVIILLLAIITFLAHRNYVMIKWRKRNNLNCSLNAIN